MVDETEVIDFSKLRRPKPRPKEPIAPRTDEQYFGMLDRIYKFMRESHPEYLESDEHVLKKPKVVKISAKKTAWINFLEICDALDRNPDHVYEFILAELGTEGSIAGGSQLILKGKYLDRNIESLLAKYVSEYVSCSSCKSWQTVLEKDQDTRLFTLECHRCKSSRSVSAIKAGYHATTKQDRMKI